MYHTDDKIALSMTSLNVTDNTKFDEPNDGENFQVCIIIESGYFTAIMFDVWTNTNLRKKSGIEM